MAATNFTPIQLYYSTTATNTPTAGNLVDGELAINIPDGKLFYKDGATVKVIASTASTTNVSSFETSLSGLTPSTATTGTVTLAGTLGPASGGTGRTTNTAYAVICGGTTTGGAEQSIASVGTAGQVLTSNGAGALPTFQSAGGGFATGTAMMFVQTAAPTGWTKSTTHDNKALRVVSGTASSGGSVAFTTAFASQTPAGSVSITAVSGTAGATTLTTPQIPSHTHSVTGNTASPFTPAIRIALSTTANSTPGSGNTNPTGGGGSHDHPFSFTSGSGTFTGTAINLAVQYVDVIIATKD
jgi:hypothetical protein